MYCLRSAVFASIWTIVLVYGSSAISSYQEQINSLSQQISLELQQLRESHREQFNEFSRQSLDAIGNFTAHGRSRATESFEYIHAVADKGDLNEQQEVCILEALAEQRLYAQVLDDDLSECAGKVYNATSADGSELFQEVTESMQLAAFLALNQGMVAVELEDSMEDRERYLREELKFLDNAWSSYLGLLERLLGEELETQEETLFHVGKCLEQAILFYDNTIDYVKDNLHECLN